MADPKGTKSTLDSAAINVGNVISVEMEDLSEKDQDELEQELQCELKEVMAERRRKKLACFQKTRGGVVKKGDNMKALVLVNSPFTLEELVHMIDVSFNNKYGANLEEVTRTIMDSVHGSLESMGLEFRQEAEGLPRQVRAIVQQVLGEARGKHDYEATDASTGSGLNTEMPFCAPGNTSRPMNLGGMTNMNLQQPYY
jgi:uncharacterized alkaline shock family protein YloU